MMSIVSNAQLNHWRSYLIDEVQIYRLSCSQSVNHIHNISQTVCDLILLPSRLCGRLSRLSLCCRLLDYYSYGLQLYMYVKSILVTL